MTDFMIDNPVEVQFEVSQETRTIRGLALPFGDVANSGGRDWSFSKGSLSWSKVKVLANHDWHQAVGTADLEETDEGLVMTARIARGTRGDDVLALAEAGVYDGLSVGLGADLQSTLRDGVHHARSGSVREVSLTPMPAFARASVTSVAASSDLTKETHMTDEVTPETEAPSVNFDGITDAIKAGFDGLSERPAVVTPAAQFEVTEPLPYRFDGIEARFSFADDIRDAQFGNEAAAKRVDEWTELAFAVTTTNVATLNPVQQRPDLYVPNLTYSRPLYEAVTTGAISDKTSFSFPKFTSATGLIAPHVEGVEPTPGAMATTSQSVQPTAMSGKVEINREVLDQGGNPQVDQVLNAEFVNAWYEAIEARIAVQLNATATAELNLASATGASLVDALTAYFAGLQFVRGGNRFTALALDGSLFPALVAAADSTGRKLLPVLGATNAQGTVSGAFDRVQLGNQTGRAAYALGSGAAARSFSFVPSSVYVWTSTPSRPRFEYQIKSVDYGFWGYCATAILRDSDVKPIDYTTAD